ncbi:MAG: hypothetical protein INQ03_25305 [Candidatus Heimdallarchaeota archaeon]|nr:hypothetical protein [Candidatus Heimdallarchaeota archaeon]
MSDTVRWPMQSFISTTRIEKEALSRMRSIIHLCGQVIFRAQGKDTSGYIDMEEEKKRLKPIPSDDKPKIVQDIYYYCIVCSKRFDIPEHMKRELLKSSSAPKKTLPTHHGREMEIRIVEE